MNSDSRRNDKQHAVDHRSSSDADGITIHGDESSQGVAEPDPTIVGADAETLDDAADTTAGVVGDASEKPSVDRVEDAERVDPTAQPTIVPSQQTPQQYAEARDSGRDTDTIPEPDVEPGGDPALQATFLSNIDNQQPTSGETYVPPAGPKKDLEDHFDTLIEDPQQKERSHHTGGLVIGDYQVLSELGRGGMGVVYKARHRKLDRVVALKMILAGKHVSGDVLTRFISEARAVAHLQHPGIVQIFDIGEHDGLPYFSLEYVDGTDLQRQLSGKTQPPREAAELVVQICDAMQYAHDHDILHRDLKPANILLDRNRSPKITDFGLAKRVDPDDATATSDGTIMGSPSYMPPEQARGELSSVTPRSDLYSLGAILYQMLTGRPPFLTDRPLDTVMQVINNDPVQLRELQPGIPVDLETICMKALQKDAASRYQSCRELAADLRRFLNGEPILARPVSRLERGWRWCRRNPKIAVPSGLASVFIIATAIISTWAWNETSAQAAIIAEERDNVKKERDEAERQRTIALQQKAVAEDNERIAQHQASLALQNIQFVITDIDEQIRDQPGMSEIRLAILDAVSDKWDELDVEMTGGVRGEAIPTFMAVRQLMAIAFRDLDELERARDEFAKLETMARERIALKGRNDATRTNLAKVLIAASPLDRRLDGNPEDSIAKLKEAAELTREIIRDPQPQEDSPGENDILQLLAAATQNLGVEYLREGRIADTRSSFAEALEASEQVLDNIRFAEGFNDLNNDQKDTRTASLQIALDKSRIGLAYILLRLGETEESLELYETAIASRREIFDRRPTVQVLRTELGGHLKLYGKSLLWIDRPEEAEPVLREAMTLSEKSWKADPEKTDLKRGFAESLYFMATLRHLQGHDDEALSLFERSRLLREELHEASPDDKNAINLMLSEARVGNVDATRELSQQLAETEEPNGELHLERARALAQLSTRADNDEQASQYRDAALTALERSVAEGYSDPFRVGAEPDLDPLHETDRFTLVIARLQQIRDEQQASSGN